MMTYEMHPEFYDNPPGARDPLFTTNTGQSTKDGFPWRILLVAIIAAGTGAAFLTIRGTRRRPKALFRCAGALQWLYAGLFGWYALWAYHGGRLYSTAGKRSASQPVYLDYRWCIAVTVLSLLAVTSFIGGYALLRLRPCVRRWEFAYLSILSIGVAIVAVGYLFVNPLWPLIELIYVVLLSLPFGLPYLPFLFKTVVESASAAKPGSWNKGPIAADLDSF
jgi:hypothetical protein